MSDSNLVRRGSLIVNVVNLLMQVILWSNRIVVNTCCDYFNGVHRPTRDDPNPFFHAKELVMSARELVECIITSQSRYRCIQNFRMDGLMFLHLCALLQNHLKVTKKLPVIVQVAIFMDWISHASSLRKQKECFKISHDLLEQARLNVARAVMKVIYPKYVKPVQVPPDLSMNKKFKRFQGVFGCIDGSHIPIIVPAENRRKWRNRKGFTSTNAMLICDTEKMLFQYALFGNEGCGSDSTIFKSWAHHIRWLQGGFLLADAGYGLCKKLLTPYRGVRYHLREFAESKHHRPRNAKELFNLRHSSMRMMIERCFGVMKNRFKILAQPLQLSCPKRMWLVMYACVALHNFIRIEDNTVDRDVEFDTDLELQEREAEPLETYATVALNEKKDLKKNRQVEEWRDQQIAYNMWQD